MPRTKRLSQGPVRWLSLKAFAIKRNGLSSILRTHIVERTNSQEILSDLHIVCYLSHRKTLKKQKPFSPEGTLKMWVQLGQAMPSVSTGTTYCSLMYPESQTPRYVRTEVLAAHSRVGPDQVVQEGSEGVGERSSVQSPVRLVLQLTLPSGPWVLLCVLPSLLGF